MGNLLPPMMQIMKDVGGVQMPEYFGKLVEEKAELPGEAGSSPDPKPTPPGDKKQV